MGEFSMNAKFRLSTLLIVSGHEITKVPISISETFTSHLKKLKFSLFSGIFSEVKNI